MSQPFSTESSPPVHPATDAQSDAKPLNRTLALKVASNLFLSFQYAGQGIIYAFRTQRNFKLHVCLGTVAIGLSFILHLAAVEIAIMGLTIGAVLSMELINTALESVVDLTVQQTYHELAKIAKDCAAAAVLISAGVSILVAGVLLAPPIVQRVLDLTQTHL